ncbi:DUF305 domain-containing protein [Mycolicibacterium cosmeticum]|uniref:DUF305 domain-containing protein n=2 Tax=Mycolicibacterium cosmeticum TaxID=258533 RepID=UPI003204A483
MQRRKSLTVGAATLAALGVLTACGNSGTKAGQTSAPPAVAPSSAPATEAHNQADVMFAQHMITHHQQAIEMSDIVLAKQGIDARVVDLANKIKAAQGPEIQQMQAWLSQWGQPTTAMMPGMGMPDQSAPPSPAPDPHHPGTPGQTETTSAMPSPSGMPAMPAMPSQTMMPNQTGMPAMPGMDGMAGMLSPQDMAALQNAQGVEASKLFLMQMTQHHQGAITMAQNEITTGQYPAAVAMARSIVTSQQQEITTMQGILGSL